MTPVLEFLDISRSYGKNAPVLDGVTFEVRTGDSIRDAASVLEDFLQRHPDYPQAETMRRRIVELRQ